MPRFQNLSQLTPNKVYSVEGIVKFIHQSEGYTTIIVQQDSVQKKIKIPSNQSSLERGKTYRFGNCFCNSNGWLMARKPNQSIQPINLQNQNDRDFMFSLKELKQNVESMEGKYFSTNLFIYSILPKQILNKNGAQIHYQVLKGYSQNFTIDITIWNDQPDIQSFLYQWVVFQGVRIKKMTEQKFVLVSTVFTKIYNSEPIRFDDQFNKVNIGNYENLSQIYKKRSIQELIDIGLPEQKIFSIIKAKIKSIVTVDYQGCPKCRRKTQLFCQNCNITTRVKFQYGKVLLQQDEKIIEVIVFDQKIRQLFKFAKENCSIQTKIKTFGRIQNQETLVSHIVTKIDSIFF